MKNRQTTKKKSKRAQEKDRRLHSLRARLDRAFLDESMPMAKRVKTINDVIGALQVEVGILQKK